MSDKSNGLLAAIRVLVVDDIASARWTVKHHLQQIGFDTIDEAKSGREALEKLRAANYKLVVSDWNMSDIHGLDLFREMKKDPLLSNIMFVMVTGSVSPKEVSEAMAAGVAAYITKPVSEDVLRKKILQLLQKLLAS